MRSLAAGMSAGQSMRWPTHLRQSQKSTAYVLCCVCCAASAVLCCICCRHAVLCCAATLTRGCLVALHGRALHRHQRVDGHALGVLRQRGQLWKQTKQGVQVV